MVNATSLAISIDSVSKAYRTGRRVIPALRDVSLTVEAGEWVAIVGPSGCGKSTMLNLLAGIDQPDAGSVEVFGTQLSRLNEGALARWRGREVGIVFQFFQLMPTLTARENVMLPMDLAGNGHNKRARADQLLDDVGLGEYASNLPSELSGGEQQRVAIARALANDPRLILADEPTGNLDSANGAAVVQLLEEVSRRGSTIVMVTHDPAIAARSGRIVNMLDGRVVDPQPVAPNGSSVEHLDESRAYARR